MCIDPELRDRVYQVFSLEIFQMLQTIETELVTLGVIGSSDLLEHRSSIKVHNLLRAAHSIKGSAATLGLDEIENLAHQLEDIFRVLDRPELPFDRDLEILLFELYDCLNRLITAQIKGETLPPSFHANTQLILATLDQKIGHFVTAGRKNPESHPFGVDLVRSIFEVDVTESIARLKRILLDLNSAHIVVGEFRAQAEVFTGIAELTDQPSFGKLARNTIEALDLQPDSAHEICCFALVHFSAALEQILAKDGDRKCGKIGQENQMLIQQGAESEEGFKLSHDLEDIFDFTHSEMISSEHEEGFKLSCDLEDIFDFTHSEMISSEHEEGFKLSHDLEDIFDFTHSEMISSEHEEGFKLSHDLEDIFDFAHSEIISSESETAVTLSHDLEDIFELPIALQPQSKIGLTIANITNNFEQFALATAETFAAPAKAIQPIRVKKARKVSPTATTQLSIRVTLDRLERMNNLMGELAIERNGLAVSNEQFTDTLDQIRSKCTNFQTICDSLQQIADTLSIHTHQPSFHSNAPDDDLDTQFDVLELDRYSEVHHIAQATIEQLAQIEEQIEDLSLFATKSHDQIDRQKQLLSHLRDDLMWARMLPLSEILNRFPRTIHDLSIEFNKPVDLKITGAGVLVDRAVIDKLLDPLVHLLRNAFDHGIDPLAVRRATGKPERGTIEITADHQGSHTVIEITDDGSGIDLDKIRSKAIALQLLTLVEAATATREQLLDLLFIPGFSTADRVTKLSGRGMGLDIVKAQIQSIKGTISIESKLGRGTTFTLRIPLTLTITQLIVCQAGNALYAFPAGSIQKILVPTPTQIATQDSQKIFHWRDLTIPIYNLADLLTYSIPVPERIISHTLKSSAHNPADWLSPLLLIRAGNQMIALEIDRMITEQELTIKPFGTAITPPSYSYGCTILGDGVILPVLDPHTLIQVSIERPHCAILPTVSIVPAISSIDSILVVDDSITTRQSLCLSLEKFGYRTLQAKDGQEALQILRQKISEIKLVVCDVEMPNMNGFEFLNIRRQDQTLTHIPVVMLTSRSNTKHRQFAAHLGAIDYFIKPYVEQDFMAAIWKIVNS
jgi:two-component system, chemotaxis family, sensor histidine kinase and response regulator PixL